MVRIPFAKYQGAGNDFILIDDRHGTIENKLSREWIERTCHRRFGIGADGMILLQQGRDGADFFMKYYNADGRTSTFCGNGGRCIVSFASTLGISSEEIVFQGIDGLHVASFGPDGTISLSMKDVSMIDQPSDMVYVLDTGSPHYVAFVMETGTLDVRTEGKAIRNSPSFEAEGINVNFVKSLGPNEIIIRTYERGVEDETLACGTGVVAAALANAVHHDDHSGFCEVHAAGGNLKVMYQRNGPMNFSEIRLSGPAEEVFRGEIDLP